MSGVMAQNKLEAADREANALSREPGDEVGEEGDEIQKMAGNQCSTVPEVSLYLKKYSETISSTSIQELTSSAAEVYVCGKIEPAGLGPR